MPNLMGASIQGVSHIPVGERVLLLAFADRTGTGVFPAALRRDVRGVFDHLTLYPRAVEAVRRFLDARGHYPPPPRPSDREVMATLGRGIGRGEIEAGVVAKVVPHRSFVALAQARTVQAAVSAVAARPGASGSSSPPGAPAGAPAPLGARPRASPTTSAAGGGDAIAALGLTERVEEILRRAAARAPGVLGVRLTAFATPRNVGLLAGGVMATGAANVGRGEWTTHRAVTAIGFAHAGLGAFPGLADVHDFAAHTQRARSEGDLDAAADALARAARTFGMLGLAAVLHKSNGEPLGGPGSVGEGLPDLAPPPTPTATGLRPTPPRTPTPAGELTAARAAAAKLREAEASLLEKAKKDLALARKAYADAVAKLRARAQALRAALRAEEATAEKEAAAVERLASELHAERRALGERLKGLMNEAKRAEAEARNLERHGDKLGPTLDALKKDGKSAKQIIDSASHSGGKPLGL